MEKICDCICVYCGHFEKDCTGLCIMCHISDKLKCADFVPYDEYETNEKGND